MTHQALKMVPNIYNLIKGSDEKHQFNMELYVLQKMRTNIKAISEMTNHEKAEFENCLLDVLKSAIFKTKVWFKS